MSHLTLLPRLTKKLRRFAFFSAEFFYGDTVVLDLTIVQNAVNNYYIINHFFHPE